MTLLQNHIQFLHLCFSLSIYVLESLAHCTGNGQQSRDIQFASLDQHISCNSSLKGRGWGEPYHEYDVLNPDCLLVSCVFAMLIECTSSYGIFEPLFCFDIYIYIYIYLNQISKDFSVNVPFLTEYRNCLKFVFSKRKKTYSKFFFETLNIISAQNHFNLSIM